MLHKVVLFIRAVSKKAWVWIAFILGVLGLSGLMRRMSEEDDPDLIKAIGSGELSWTTAQEIKEQNEKNKAEADRQIGGINAKIDGLNKMQEQKDEEIRNLSDDDVAKRFREQGY